MDFTADHYFEASLERVNQAQRLFREGDGSFALAMYASGLAVECLLRAYMLKRKPTFESRHDLFLLFKENFKKYDAEVGGNVKAAGPA